MKLSTLFAIYREAVARRDIAGNDYMNGWVKREHYGKRIRQCDRLERVIARRIVAMEAAGESAK